MKVMVIKKLISKRVSAPTTSWPQATRRRRRRRSRDASECIQFSIESSQQLAAPRFVPRDDLRAFAAAAAAEL